MKSIKYVVHVLIYQWNHKTDKSMRDHKLQNFCYSSKLIKIFQILTWNQHIIKYTPCLNFYSIHLGKN